MKTMVDLASELQAAVRAHELTKGEAVARLLAAFKLTEASAADILENGVRTNSDMPRTRPGEF